MKRRERGRRRALERVGERLLGGEVSRADQPEAVDQLDLLGRASAHQPAILELRRGQCAEKSPLGARQALAGALHRQRRDHCAGPGGDPI